MTEKITRDQVEKLLWEVTGFRGDATQMDAMMLAVEAWAVDMAGCLAAAPETLRESHLHLVVQMGELILDSGGRLAATQRLADQVQVMQGQLQSLTVQVQSLVTTVIAMSAGVPDREEGEVPAWERDFLARQAADEHTRLSREIELHEATMVELGEPAAAVILLECRSCGLAKTSDHFFKNSKSRTGYETKCRECRKAA